MSNESTTTNRERAGYALAVAEHNQGPEFAVAKAQLGIGYALLAIADAIEKLGER